MPRLVRKQIYITPEQDELLKRAAVRERRTEAEIIRTALNRRLGPKRATARAYAGDPLLGIVGIGSSNRKDVSQRVDELLYRRKRS